MGQKDSFFPRVMCLCYHAMSNCLCNNV
uniref:Uncharacterized protein n=1 Tax=Anguilla anguilla TaxID=7936 RepID=A0A0E9QE89_ANGAN